MAFATAIMVALATASQAELPAAFFPPGTPEPQTRNAWTALAEKYPNRIRSADSPADESAAPPTRVAVREGLDYLRVHRIDPSLSAIAAALQTPRLVLDLRYVHGDLDEAIAFGRLLARQDRQLLARPGGEIVTIAANPHRPGGQLTLILVNGETAGPLEAVLDALQSGGDVLLVGSRTAGDTGVFAPAAGAPDWKTIVADYRRNAGPELLDVGVAPGLPVRVSAEAEEEAYLALDAGTALAALLDAPVEKPRFDEATLQQQFAHAAAHTIAPAAPAAQADEGDATMPDLQDGPDGKAGAGAPVPSDRTLQRAVNTLIALDALNRLPSGRGA